MKVKKLPNGQIEVKHENLTLTHSNVKGNKFNDCEIDRGDYYETVNENNDMFKPLFIALYNFKINME